jgi:hypothetical protein
MYQSHPWSQTVAIDIFSLLNVQFSCKNCVTVSAQYFLKIGKAHRTGKSHFYCAIPNGAPKGPLSKCDVAQIPIKIHEI